MTLGTAEPDPQPLAFHPVVGGEPGGRKKGEGSAWGPRNRSPRGCSPGLPRSVRAALPPPLPPPELPPETQRRPPFSRTAPAVSRARFSQRCRRCWEWQLARASVCSSHLPHQERGLGGGRAEGRGEEGPCSPSPSIRHRLYGCPWGPRCGTHGGGRPRSRGGEEQSGSSGVGGDPGPTSPDSTASATSDRCGTPAACLFYNIR